MTARLTSQDTFLCSDHIIMSAAIPAVVATTVIGGITVYDDYVHHLASIPTNSHPQPFLLQKHIDQLLKTDSVAPSALAAAAAVVASSWSSSASSSTPLTSTRSLSQYIYTPQCQFQLTLFTGPRFQRVMHLQAGEEWYYALQGDVEVRYIEGREAKTMALKTGTCVLIPGGTPKSLQLSVGAQVVVVTRQRKSADTYPHYNKEHVVPQLTHLNGNAIEKEDPQDQLLWPCEKCGDIAHSVSFQCSDYLLQSGLLATQFDAQAASGDIKCPSCGCVYSAVKSIMDTTTNATGGGADVNATFSAPKKLPDTSTYSYPQIDSSTHPPPYHLLSWIETHRASLQPPVCNKMIHGRACQFKVMIVGGPNQRTDYHIDDGEEWFLMLQGDMVLKVVDQQGTQWKDIVIKQGESFLLPANVPHSPQRYANTIGLVIERDRFTYELDGLRWWCSNVECRSVLRTFSFRCEDLGSQLKTLIQYWYEESEEGKERRTCKKCGHVETKPVALDQIKQWTH